MESQVSVSIMGVGAMGSALAHAFLRQGRRTVVWNRTPAKAERLVSHGAQAVLTPIDAVLASPVIVICVSDYSTAREALTDTAAHLRGRTFVNLTNGRPQEARAFAQWAASHGADYLDGGIMAIPPMIGRPEALILYSGSESAYRSHRALLELLGQSRYLGPDAGRAALHDLALLSGMYGLFAGAFQALALVRSEDVKAGEFTPLLVDWLKAMAATLPDYARQIDAGDYTLDVVANAAMQTESLRNITRACREHGIRSDLLEPLLRLLETWVATGHGQNDITGVVDLITAHAPSEDAAAVTR